MEKFKIADFSFVFAIGLKKALKIIDRFETFKSMRIYVKVIAKSSRNKIEKIGNDDYKVWTTALPIKGQANEEVVKLLADFFSVSKYQIKISGGKTTSRKIIDIQI